MAPEKQSESIQIRLTVAGNRPSP